MSSINKKENGRYDFEKGKLEKFKYDDPILFFNEWFQEANEKDCTDPNAMVLSTVNVQGQPSSRVVYVRQIISEGFIIYTNYLSKKGGEIMNNHKVAGLFYWDCCERQVRIEGEAEKVDNRLSDDYFANRPRMSQIGAWASQQSSEIDNRLSLEERVNLFEKKYPNEVPRPPHWGGYLIKPHYFEFWQGRSGRLHDRLCYLKENEQWKTFRIAP